MKSLITIQKLMKAGKILSKIAFIVSIVGFCITIVCMISLGIGFDSFKIGGVTVYGIIKNSTNMSFQEIYAMLVSSIIMLAGEAVLAKFAERYFKKELKVGTPFDDSTSKDLLNLGILAIVIPIGTQIISEIINALIGEFSATEISFSVEISGTGMLGIMFIVMSFVCRYGAELQNALNMQIAQNMQNMQNVNEPAVAENTNPEQL